MANGTTGRILPVTGTESARQTAAASVLAGEIHSTSDGERLFLQNEIIAPYFHGDVASSAAMTALASSTRGTWRADTCRRTDLNNRYFICINNDGSNATDWIDMLSLSGSSGDILYHNGTNWVPLAKGTNGHVLTLSGGLPAWAAGGGGGGSSYFNCKRLILNVPLDEASGDRHGWRSSPRFSDNNTVGATTGLVYDNRAVFVAGNSEALYLDARSNDLNRLFKYNGNESCTVSFWGKITATPGSSGFFFSTGDGSSSDSWFGINVSTDRSLFVFIDDGSNIANVDSGVDLTVNQLYHIVMTIDRVNDLANFWIDGTDQSVDVDISSVGDCSPADGNLYYTIGCRWLGSLTAYLSCEVEQLLFFNRLLSDSEIGDLYNSGSGLAILEP